MWTELGCHTTRCVVNWVKVGRCVPPYIFRFHRGNFARSSLSANLDTETLGETTGILYIVAVPCLGIVAIVYCTFCPTFTVVDICGILTTSACFQRDKETWSGSDTRRRMQHSWVCCPRSTFFSQRVWSISHLDVDECSAVAQSLLAQLRNRLDDRATGDCVFIYSVRSEACDTQSSSLYAEWFYSVGWIHDRCHVHAIRS